MYVCACAYGVHVWGCGTGYLFTVESIYLWYEIFICAVGCLSVVYGICLFICGMGYLYYKTCLSYSVFVCGMDYL